LLRLDILNVHFLRSTEQLGNTTDDQRLLNYLLQDYKNRRLVRPVKDRSKAVVIDFSAELIGVAKVVRKKLKPLILNDYDFQQFIR